VFCGQLQTVTEDIFVPDSRISNRKSPTAVCAEPVARDGDLMTAGQMQALVENSVRNWCAVVGQILRSLVMLGSVHEHTENLYSTFILDSFWNVKSMDISMLQ